MLKKDVNILLIEDDIVDQNAMKRALKECKLSNPLYIAGNGLEALEMLRGEREPTISPPFLIILDLNMPKMDGFEFLSELRSDHLLKNSPVFVLTASEDKQAMQTAYDLNATAYIVKSFFIESFIEAVSLLDSQWQVSEAV